MALEIFGSLSRWTRKPELGIGVPDPCPSRSDHAVTSQIRGIPSVGIAPKAKRRLHDECDLGCEGCGAAFFVLTRRLRTNGSWSIELQCDNCGRSTGHPFSRDEHPRWETYIQFDEGKWPRAREEPSMVLLDAEHSREDYQKWLKDSPEWHDLRWKVMERDGGHCQACLSAPAQDIHHRTYRYGRLPPAWHLIAVCRPCHDRLGDRQDEWREP